MAFPLSNPHRHSPFAAVLGALTVVTTVAVAQTRYSLTPITPLTGAVSTRPSGISATGEVAGSSTTSMPQAWIHADQTGAVAIGALPGASWAHASDVNALGQAVGESGSRAFLYDPATGMIDIAAGAVAIASAVNNRGQVAGTLDPYSLRNARAFVWDPTSGLTVLTTTPIGRAVAINDAGQVAGYEGARAFRYTPGAGMLYLPLVTAYPLSYAIGINRYGDIVGIMSSANGNTSHLFSYSDASGMQDLGLFVGAPSAINRDGIVVGVRSAGGDKAIVRSPSGTVTDLNTLVSGASGYQLRAATDINDAGQIACLAWYQPTFRYVAVRLDPMTARATSVPAGSGCGTPAPELDSTLPVLGAALSFSVRSAPASASGLLFIALSRPVRLAFGSGCTVYVDPAATLALTAVSTDGAGNGTTQAIPVPADPALAGWSTTVQGAFPGTPGPLGIALTNATVLVFGS